MLALIAMTEGCQPKGPSWNLGQVQGTVTQSGQPLAGVRVTFLADVAAGTQGPRTSGFTDASGHYELRTDGGDLGAAIGKYHVTIADLQATDGDRPFAKGRKRGRLMKKTPGDAKPAEEGKEGKTDENPPAEVKKSRVPPEYSDWAKTPLKDVEVKPGSQTLDFNVEPNK